MVGILIYSAITFITIVLAIFVVVNIIIYLKDFIKEINYFKTVICNLNLGQKILFWSIIVIVIITAVFLIAVVLYNTVSLIIK